MTVPIAAAIMAISTSLAPQVTLFSLLVNVILVSLRTIANIVFLLGLTLLIPVFAEEVRARTMGMMINLQVIIFLTIGLEIGLSSRKMFPNPDPYTSLLITYPLNTAIILLAGFVLLYLGKRKMNNIE